MFIAEIDILAVGIRDRGELLEQMPVRILLVDRAYEAISCLRRSRIRTMASKWNLPDMTDGKLLQRVIEAKPEMPTIAVIESGSFGQEVAARKLGVTIVLPEDVDDGRFDEAICQVLGLRGITSIKGRYEIERNKNIMEGTKSAHLLVSPIHSLSPSWVCNPVSDQRLSDPAEYKRSRKLLRYKYAVRK